MKAPSVKETCIVATVGIVPCVLYPWIVHLLYPDLDWNTYATLAFEPVKLWLVIYGFGVTFYIFLGRRRFDMGLASGRDLDERLKENRANKEEALKIFADCSLALQLAIHVPAQEIYDFAEAKSAIEKAEKAKSGCSCLGDKSFAKLWDEFVQSARFVNGKIREIAPGSRKTASQARIKATYLRKETGFAFQQLKGAVDARIKKLRDG